MTISQTGEAKKRRKKPRYATRKPKDYQVKAPGDLVEIDTLVIKLLPNLVRYQFTARDFISKWDGLKRYCRQTSFCDALFLDYLEKKLPFKIKAIQIDGGSEFKKHFEAECQKRDILLFVLSPKRPDLNGGVERANGRSDCISRHSCFMCAQRRFFRKGGD
ncbi:MAG: hypothetical protein JW991_00295 [Candidatus Pacebacteria bacterium]|nr:hypothetical protein [Candidatus Paceibacterota bacterium]